MNFQVQFLCIRYKIHTAAVDRYRKCQISCLHLCCLGTFNLIATDVILDAWQGRHQMKSCLHPATRSNLCSSFSSPCRDLATGGYSLWASDRTFFQKPPRPSPVTRAWAWGCRRLRRKVLQSRRKPLLGRYSIGTPMQLLRETGKYKTLCYACVPISRLVGAFSMINCNCKT